MNAKSAYRSFGDKRNSRCWRHVRVVAFWLMAGIATGASAEPTLTLLHTSEHHGQSLPIEPRGQKRIGGMAGRATLVAKARKESNAVLLLDSGDILIGTAMSSLFRGEPDILAMNLMGYQAMAAGNHEFDYGLDHLRRLQELARFPILCSNLVGKAIELPCHPSAIVHVGELSIGLLGLLGRHNFPDTFNREVVKLLELRDPIETARQTAHQLRSQGAELIIAITHQDTDEDLAMLSDLPEIDVIVGGHTPGFDGLRTRGSALAQEQRAQPGAVFVKTHREGRTLGRLDLQLARSPNGRASIGAARARNLPVTEDLSPEPAVADLLNGYVRKMDEQSARVFGHSRVRLDGEVNQIRTRETNLGNLLTDLLRAEFGTEVAMLNSGQIRDSIPKGPVDLKQVLRVLPFESSIVTVTITGQQLRQVFENSVSMLPSTSGRFLQVSGLTVTYDLSAPFGTRIRTVLVGGRPLEELRRYSVTTDAFIADGGDGYTMFDEAKDRIDRQVPIRDLLLRALQSRPLDASVEGRIRVREAP